MVKEEGYQCAGFAQNPRFSPHSRCSLVRSRPDGVDAFKFNDPVLLGYNNKLKSICRYVKSSLVNLRGAAFTDTCPLNESVSSFLVSKASINFGGWKPPPASVNHPSDSPMTLTCLPPLYW